ncbi:MAG: hypothetical protein ABF751_05085, partial [Acetobacter orientalis]|uniref:hypothetical protein n=1 Tax=Acetobacter orientalis TaxID=146474 RepID=UPI0039E9E5D5
PLYGLNCIEGSNPFPSANLLKKSTKNKIGYYHFVGWLNQALLGLSCIIQHARARFLQLLLVVAA